MYIWCITKLDVTYNIVCKVIIKVRICKLNLRGVDLRGQNLHNHANYLLSKV